MANIILEADSLDNACHQLVDAANKAGGQDNIGVIVVKIM
jgi:serine/threonine protein phosphatase PrpC